MTPMPQDPDGDSTDLLPDAAVQALVNFAQEEDESDSQIAQVGDEIGHYKLLDRLGDGGFGEVWLAGDQRDTRRRVALKIIKPGMDTREVLKRFEIEQQVLAVMKHPNIAALFDWGSTKAGRPYFVMEYVEGVTITKYCAQKRLPLRERLRLFQQLCAGVQHAHMKGIVHRDLSPTNVLVTTVDGQPVVKIIDFGIAKALNSELARHSYSLDIGRLVGKEPYMSPEQMDCRPLADGRTLDVDSRTDVYSLGVIYYELLTGTTPHGTRELLAKGHLGMRDMLIDHDTDPPSTRITRLQDDQAKDLSKHMAVDVRTLTRSLRGELDWIALRALEKDREHRYQSPTGLSDDIHCFLIQKPLRVAGPRTWQYTVSKVIKRHRVAIFALLAVSTTLVASTAISIWKAYEAQVERFRADELTRHLATRNIQLKETIDALALKNKQLSGYEEQFYNLLESVKNLPPGEGNGMMTILKSAAAISSKKTTNGKVVQSADSDEIFGSGFLPSATGLVEAVAKAEQLSDDIKRIYSAVSSQISLGDFALRYARNEAEVENGLKHFKKAKDELFDSKMNQTNRALIGLLLMVHFKESGALIELQRWQDALASSQNSAKALRLLEATNLDGDITRDLSAVVTFISLLSHLGMEDFRGVSLDAKNCITTLEHTKKYNSITSDTEYILFFSYIAAALADFIPNQPDSVSESIRLIQKAIDLIEISKQRSKSSHPLKVENVAAYMIKGELLHTAGKLTPKEANDIDLTVVDIVSTVPENERSRINTQGYLAAVKLFGMFRMFKQGNTIASLLVGSLDKPDSEERYPPRQAITMGELYGNLAYGHLLTKQYYTAERYARRGIALLPEPWIDINLAHALLLQGKTGPAEAIYRHYLDQGGEGKDFLVEKVKSDFEDLQKEGIEDQAMGAMARLIDKHKTPESEDHRWTLGPADGSIRNDNNSGAFKGIGVSFAKTGQSLFVKVISDSTPAAKSELRVVDQVLSINGRDTSDLSEIECIALIRDSLDEVIELRVGSASGRSKLISIRKDWIKGGSNLNSTGGYYDRTGKYHDK